MKSISVIQNFIIAFSDWRLHRFLKITRVMWSGKLGDKSGKKHGIWIQICVATMYFVLVTWWIKVFSKIFRVVGDFLPEVVNTKIIQLTFNLNSNTEFLDFSSFRDFSLKFCTFVEFVSFNLYLLVRSFQLLLFCHHYILSYWEMLSVLDRCQEWTRCRATTCASVVRPSWNYRWPLTPQAALAQNRYFERTLGVQERML